MLAIKNLTPEDEEKFKQFLATPRKKLPKLKVSHLSHPFKDIFISNFNLNASEDFIYDNKYIFKKFHDFSIVCQDDIFFEDNTVFLFSGYCFYKSRMLIGQKNVFSNIKYKLDIDDLYGEFSYCKITPDKIICMSDYFGMAVWFYYVDDNNNFAASNNYHLLLRLITQNIKKIKMNIPRSRVNILTSGFTYGTPFTNKLDVENFYINFATENIIFNKEKLEIKNKSLWFDLYEKEDWDEQKYKEYIYKAKEEIYSCCLAAAKCENFSKIVVDVSGGFDSRVVFATINNLPDILRKKIFTHTRKSGTKDDVEKALALTNIYNYGKVAYSKTDQTKLDIDKNDEINLDHISRTLGTYSVSSYLYTSKYDDFSTLELTGYLGEVTLGFKRCRGELNYKLGDQRLLRRLGGCYLHNEVTQLAEVFNEQSILINETLKRYNHCDCLFKKNHLLYTDTRNRFICNSSHNVENNNLRIPMLFSRYALKAKWMYFNLFSNNRIPPEKVSIDLIDSINNIMGALPFAEDNNDVIPDEKILLNHSKVKIIPDKSSENLPTPNNKDNLYKDQVIKYIDNLDTAKQMLLSILDYSEKYRTVCFGLYTVIRNFETNPSELRTSHGRETIRKIYDIYFQISEIRNA